MSPELASQLFKTYPELYRARLGAGDLPIKVWGIECEDGWFQLISDLSAELVETATRTGKDAAASDWPEVIQVKQKFGELRVYLSQPNANYDPALEAYRLRSRQTCEVCGQPGEIKRTRRRSVTTCLRHSPPQTQSATSVPPVWIKALDEPEPKGQ